MPLSKDLREFIECLNSSKAEYLIVGALAVSWHGFPRYSADVDLLVRAEPSNAGRVLQAIRQFGFGSLDISIEDLAMPGKVIQLGFEPNRIDIITSITGVSFDEAWQTRVGGEIDGLPIQLIGRAALIRNKEAAGRPKDRIDVEELRRQEEASER
jgi:hypothetical protein